jgi:hypothetical protein
MMRQRWASWAARVVPLLVAGLVVACALVLPASVAAHGVASRDYDTKVLGIEPKGLPIEVSVVGGDRLRIENLGDEELTICGYLSSCEPYVKLGPKGVFENRNSQAYYANLDAQAFGEVPADAGKGAPKWVRVRREPAFFTYHDHRIHWMGGSTLPPGVDSSDSAPQKVTDAKVALMYGDTPVVVDARLYYVGGQSFVGRYAEYLLTALAVLLMVAVFVRDARRRRRARPSVAAEDLPELAGAIDR